MSRLNRLMLTAVALGVAACGDDVTVQPPAPPPVTVVVTPDGATIVVGATLQMNAAVSGGPGGAATIAWTSSNNATATVSNTGLVTGVAAGSVGITATATVGTSSGAGSATVTVESDQPELPPTVSIANITNTVCGAGGAPPCNDVPVNLAAVAGQINVSLNLERNNNPVTKVALLMGDVEVASQEFNPSAPIGSGAAAVPEVIQLSVNTAAFNTTTGVPSFTNGPTTLSAEVEVEGGEGPAAGNSRNLTLANSSGIVFLGISNDNNNAIAGIELPDAAVNPTTGISWTAGHHTLSLLGVSYVAGARIASTSVTLFGITRNIVLAEGAVTTQVYNNSSTAPSIAGYQTVAVNGDSPDVNSSVLSNGSPGPNIDLNTLSIPLPDVPALPVARVDNLAPGTAPTFDPAVIWVNQTFDFQDMILTAGADAGVNDVESAFFAGTAPLPASACSTTGLALVDAGGDLAASTVSTAHALRVVTYDALGNAICQDPGTVGADFVAPTGSIATGPANGSATNTAVITGWSFTGSDNASGFGAEPVEGVIVRLNSNGTTTCVLGIVPTAGGCTPDTAPLAFDAFNGQTTDGYYTFDPITLNDQAGNPLTFNGRTFLLDQVPASITGGLTLQALYTGNSTAVFTTAANAATDNMDLNSVFGTLVYGAVGTLQFPPQSLGTFGAPLEKSATINLSIPNFIRCLNAAGDYTTTTNKAGTVGLNVSDFAQPTPSALTFAIPAVNVQDCNAVGNIPGTDILTFGMLPPDYGTGKTQVDIDGASLATASAASVTLKGEAEVAINTSVDPFTRVDFYFQNAAGNWVQFGTATGVLRQTSAPARFYTYTLVWDPAADVPVGAVTVRVIGVDAQGDAVFSTTETVTTVP